MIEVIKCEFKKLKRTNLFLIGFMSALLPAVFNVLLLSQGRVPEVSWHGILQNINLMMGLMLNFLFSALLVSDIFSKEYSNRTINSIFTTPHKRYEFIISKFIVILSVLIFTFISAFILAILTGIIVKAGTLTNEIIILLFKMFGVMLINLIAIMPIYIFASLLSKNNVPALVSAMTAVVLNMVVISSDKYNMIFPGTNSFIMNAMILGKMVIKSSDIMKFSISLGVVFLVFSILSYKAYQKGNV